MIITNIVKIKYIYCAMLVEIKTLFKMHSKYVYKNAQYCNM